MMTDTSSLTLRISSETKAKLERLAGHTHRTRNFLAGQALADYLDRELAIVEAIESGREAVRAGRYVSNDEAFRQVDEIIEAARAKA